MDPATLLTLPRNDLIALVEAQTGQIVVLAARIADLEARLAAPLNNPDNSSLPPIRPIVTRINRYRGVCPCCRKAVSAAAPVGLEPGSPFGPGIAALIIHQHITEAVTRRDLSTINNACKGALRPSVIFRKVTNGFLAA